MAIKVIKENHGVIAWEVTCPSCFSIMQFENEDEYFSDGKEDGVRYTSKYIFCPVCGEKIVTFSAFGGFTNTYKKKVYK